MRIIRHRVAEWVDPAQAFATLFASSRRSFWLDGGAHAISGMSYMGASSTVATASVVDGTVTLSPSGRVLTTSILDFLREQPRLPTAPLPTAPLPTAPLPTAPLPTASAGTPLGWIGWLGYEVRAQTTGVPATRPSRHPDAALLHVDRLLAFDHSARTIELVALGPVEARHGDEWTSDLKAWRDTTLAALLNAPDVGSPAASVPEGTNARWRDGDEEYLANIAACQEWIRQGEAYQLCLTTEVFVDARPDPLATWLALREASPTHHGGYLRVDDVSLLSTSPERFLFVGTDGTVESKPIKGTRPRGATPDDDEVLRAELVSSAKERAENLMIVDLMRNDLGRVCEIGSVGVPELLAVESYAQVHQLVSTVRGRLAADRHPVDAVEACFPAGSMTGAPKLRATELLDALEERPRGLYSGAFGYFGVDGSVDLAMTIRSIVLDATGATIGAGGGITASSIPTEELAEVKLKAAALLAVLGA